MNTIPCARCGVLCNMRDEGNPDARLLRRTTAPDGLCATCALAAFLLSATPIAAAIEVRGPAMLLDTRVRLQIWRLLSVGRADAQPGEIDWERLVAEWALPFPKRRKSRRSGGG